MLKFETKAQPCLDIRCLRSNATHWQFIKCFRLGVSLQHFDALDVQVVQLKKVDMTYRISSNRRPGRLLFQPRLKGGVYWRVGVYWREGVYYFNRYLNLAFVGERASFFQLLLQHTILFIYIYKDYAVFIVVFEWEFSV